MAVSQLAIKLLFLPALILVGFCTMAILLGRIIPRRWIGWITLGLSALFLVRAFLILLTDESVGSAFDFDLFWSLGRAFLDGKNPYDSSLKYSQPVIYPPNAPPVLALLALMPKDVSYWMFEAINLALAVFVGPLAWGVLASLDTSEKLQLSRREATILGLAVAFSPAIGMIFDIGHITLLLVGCLLVSLLARGMNRPVLAGILLTPAAIKPSLVVPFLMLFCRRRDTWTWVTLAIGSLLLCYQCGSIDKFPSQYRRISESAAEMWSPGGMNDYTFANIENAETMIGFNHTLFRLGLRDSRQIQLLSAVAVILLGAWVLWNTVCRRAWSSGGVCSLVSIYSMLFFYHRVYDGVVLILPILYAANKIRSVSGCARWWYFTSAIACFFVLFTPGRFLKWILIHSLAWDGWVGWTLQALVLPWAMWALIIALVTLTCAERLLSHQRLAVPEAA